MKEDRDKANDEVQYQRQKVKGLRDQIGFMGQELGEAGNTK
jgi:hypothetical protein